MRFQVIQLAHQIPAGQAAIQVDREWLTLVQYVQQNPYSELKIIFKDGRPTMIEEGVKHIKLD